MTLSYLPQLPGLVVRLVFNCTITDDQLTSSAKVTVQVGDRIFGATATMYSTPPPVMAKIPSVVAMVTTYCLVVLVFIVRNINNKFFKSHNSSQATELKFWIAMRSLPKIFATDVRPFQRICSRNVVK